MVSVGTVVELTYAYYAVCRAGAAQRSRCGIPDVALATLTATLEAVRLVRTHGIAPGPWDEREEWLNARISEQWRVRGACSTPGSTSSGPAAVSWSEPARRRGPPLAWILAKFGRPLIGS